MNQGVTFVSFQGVAYAVEGLVHTAQNSSDDQGILNNVSSSAEEAQKALDELIRFIKQTPLSTQQDGTSSTSSWNIVKL